MAPLRLRSPRRLSPPSGEHASRFTVHEDTAREDSVWGTVSEAYSSLSQRSASDTDCSEVKQRAGDAAAQWGSTHTEARQCQLHSVQLAISCLADLIAEMLQEDSLEVAQEASGSHLHF